VCRLLYDSFSKKDARSQSDTVSQLLAHVVEAVVCYMAASAKKDARSQSDTVVAVAGSHRRRLLYGSFSKKDARNLTPLSQSFVGCNSELNAVVAMIKRCGDSNVAYE
jgi:hypothetical protein